ncbi:MAG: 1,4-dihydroxy-6-naphthoate synthase [Bacteroidales bacterium]|nr:1,4-dihydroxy-6-naphthoate synthase [Bacteroidales bacterium]
MKLSLGFSTCPNDTFIFDAAVHHKIDTEGIQFELILADVEELNKKAFEGKIDITKLSYHAYSYAAENYVLLNSGSALGNNNGPLLISKKKIYRNEVNDLKIAIPGKFTTANLLLGIAYPKAKNKIPYLFSDIEDAVNDEEVDAGLIIHENRFTYEAKGLKKIIDLGEFWENMTKTPIPLGGIVINRKHPPELQLKISNIIKTSIEFAYKNPESSLSYIKQYAQEMNAEIMKKHIDLYVNNFSLDLGKVGKNAVKTLYNEASERDLIPEILDEIFIKST